MSANGMDIFKRRKREHLRNNNYFACSFVIRSLTFNVPSEVYALVLVLSCMTIYKVIAGQMRNNLEVQIS